MTTLTCTQCGKRLSRKTARQIDGVVLCSACMFKPRPSRDRSPEGRDAQRLDAKHESAISSKLYQSDPDSRRAVA